MNRSDVGPTSEALFLHNHGGWHVGLRLLAVQRSAPLWPILGLPGRIVRDPTPLRRAAYDTERPLPYPYQLDDPQPRNYTDRLVLFHRSVGVAYGERVALLVHEWMRCNFVDESESMRWAKWGAVLPELAGCYPGHPRIPAPWEQEKADRFRAAVRRYFNDAAWAREEGLVAAAYDIELSAEEHNLLIDGDELLDILEFGRSAIDVLRTSRALRSLAKWFSASDWRTLVEWARETNPTIGLPRTGALPEPFVLYLPKND
jgi:hypothetical protein